MICPKCQTEIKEGYLYCQKCGEEIIMVPDYEVELEEGIEQTISEVAEMMAGSAMDEEMQPLEDTQPLKDTGDVVVINDIHTEKNSGIPGKIWLLIGGAVAAVLILAVVIILSVRAVKDYYSYDVQYAKAYEEFTNGEYEAVIKTCRHINSINSREEAPRLLLADSYSAVRKYDEAIAVLDDLKNDFPKEKGIYERLLANYEMEGDVDSILRMSEQCEDPSIRALFGDYVSDPPLFDEAEGIYPEPVSIRLMSADNGNIYYTLDGSEPDQNALYYTTPILIEEGTVTITAVHVNEKGVTSEAVSATYTVENPAPDAPVLKTAGGDYSVPALIRVDAPDTGTVYYTTDGSDPDEQSSEYTIPLAMPLGKSEYRFVTINDSGKSSEVVVAEYNLKVSGILDANYAATAVQMLLMTTGHDVMSHEFKAVSGYSQSGHNYYMVEEYTGHAEGRKKLKTVYAVDSQTGEIFTITQNKKSGSFDFGTVY